MLGKLPLGEIGSRALDFVILHCQVPVWIFSTAALALDNAIQGIVTFAPAPLLVLVVSGLAYRAGGWRLGLLSILGLSFLLNQNLWQPTIETFSLALTSTILSLVLAVPIGIALGKNPRVEAIVSPLLDFAQTMPRFVYMIPAVIVFGIDLVPAVFATMTLALVPPIRIIALAFQQIDGQLIEASDAFGSSSWRTLIDLELPLVGPSLLLAVNQCFMMSLSMSVITSLIGAGGLGKNILVSIAALNPAQGIVAGIGIVLIAILSDRIFVSLTLPAAK